MVALVAVTALSGGTRAAEPERCSLGDRYPVQSVTPYVTFEDAGYTTYNQLRGAELIVPAQPGLTREWLQRVLAHQVATGACDLGAHNVAVTVLPAGAAFSVRLSGSDDNAAKLILSHARELVK